MIATFSLPPGAMISWNSLYLSKEPRYLSQDLLLVELPNDTFIDVSWFPEHDPAGSYTVAAYRGTWGNQLVQIGTNSPHEVVTVVEALATHFSRRIAPVSCSSGSSGSYDFAGGIGA